MADEACVSCVVQDSQTSIGLSDAINNPLPGARQQDSSKAAYDPLDASTFVPPTALPAPSATIEFCDRV